MVVLLARLTERLCVRFSSSDYDVVPFTWCSFVGASVVRIRSCVGTSVGRISRSCVVTSMVGYVSAVHVW